MALLLLEVMALLLLGATAQTSGPSLPSSTTATDSLSRVRTTSSLPVSSIADNCAGDTECRACLGALVTAVGGVSIDNREYQRAFVRALESESACNAAQSYSVRGLKASMIGRLGFGVAAWAGPLVSCWFEPDCRPCARAGADPAIYNNRTDVIRLCNVSQPSVQEFIIDNPGALIFPHCTYNKQLCYGDQQCGWCARMIFEDGRSPREVLRLTEGDGEQLCPIASSSAVLSNLSGVIEMCVDSTVSCEYWATACQDDPVCAPCFAAVDGGDNLVDGLRSQECLSTLSSLSAQANTITVISFNNYFYSCPDVSKCTAARFNCVSNNIDCLNCLDGTASGNDSVDGTCADLLAGWGVPSSCMPCSPSVAELNRLTYATMVFGALSLVGCGCAILVIVALSKDTYALRERILLGLLVANMVYSSANVIPVALRRDTDGSMCGMLELQDSTIRSGRSWWFAGKYGIVFFEIFILAASIQALRGGYEELTWKWECAGHLLCVVGGLAAFGAFYARCSEINAAGYNDDTYRESLYSTFTYGNYDDEVDDGYTPSAAASERYSQGREQYDALLQLMLRVWIGLLGLALLLWLYLRGLYLQLREAWHSSLTAAEQQWDRDLWGDDQQGVRRTRRRLLELVREGYDEVAEPLEPFVVLFVLFGIPAAVMSSNYCADRSGAISTEQSANLVFGVTYKYGLCDAWCELVLSLRSLATAAIYFYPRQHRVELVSGRRLWRGLWQRGCRVWVWAAGGFSSGTARSGRTRAGGKVKFSATKMEEVRLYEVNPDEHAEVDLAAAELVPCGPPDDGQGENLREPLLADGDSGADSSELASSHAYASNTGAADTPC